MRSIVRLGGLLLTVSLIAAPTSCPGKTSDGQVFSLLNRPDIQARIKQDFGFTIHVLRDPLPAGTEVYPEVPGVNPAELGAQQLVCEGRCILGMIDLMPRAHFAHDVVIAVYDLDNKILDAKLARWWPWVPATGERFFHTVAERKQWLVRHPQSNYQVYEDPDVNLGAIVVPTPQPSIVPMLPSDQCQVWAVIVNGYDDPDDSFDEDTQGMYDVLHGMGVPDNRICYLTDDTGARGHDDLARPENVQAALKYIEQHTNGSIDSATKEKGLKVCGGLIPPPATDCLNFLLFISTHGGADPPSLLCNHFKDDGTPHGGKIEQGELFQWMGNIDSTHSTVVIEACHSGSFLPELKGLPQCSPPAGCSVFLSAGASWESFADLDPPEHHDDNPGDAGSETIWGFVEAFGTSEADLVGPGGGKDGRISFNEAVLYAQKKDASPKVGNDPRSAVWPVGPIPAGIPYLDCTHPPNLPQASKVEITNGPHTASTTNDEAGATLSLAKRCRANEFELELKNVHTSHSLPVGTVRLHFEKPNDIGPDTWDYASTVIVPGLVPSAVASYAVEWNAGSDLDVGDLVNVVASVDSPQSPLTTPSNQQATGRATVVEQVQDDRFVRMSFGPMRFR